MNVNKLLRPFKNRLLFEAYIKSFLSALTLGAATSALAGLMLRLKEVSSLLPYSLAFGGFICLLSFPLFLSLRDYPTRKKIASRLDGLGLQDRVSTMLEYQKDDSPIAEIQRKDTLERLKAVAPKTLPIRIGKRYWIPCLVSLVLATAVLLLGHVAPDMGQAEDTARLQRESVMADMLQELRQQVKEAGIADSLKESLLTVIDQLEQDLEKVDGQLQETATIDAAKRRIEQILEDALTRKPIGTALQQYADTFDLGKALYPGEIAPVLSALQVTCEEQTDDPASIEKYVSSLNGALSACGVDPADSLYGAIDSLSRDLAEAQVDTLSSLYAKAGAAIEKALMQQAEIEALKEALADRMSSAKDTLLGYHRIDLADPDLIDQGQDSPLVDITSDIIWKDGQTGGGDAQHNAGTGVGYEDGDSPSMRELVYDPEAGLVTYGKVLSSYYARYLADVTAGKIPKELQQIIDSYYIALN